MVTIAAREVVGFAHARPEQMDVGIFPERLALPEFCDGLIAKVGDFVSRHLWSRRPANSALAAPTEESNTFGEVFLPRR
jgi:hypothetical protein